MKFSDIIKKWYPLFLISAVSLFLELAVIRWLSAEVRIFSYFKNLALLAAFLGLAIGFGLVKRKENYWKRFAPTTLAFFVIVLTIGRLVSPEILPYPAQNDEILWYSHYFSFWLSFFLFVTLLLIFFLLVMFLFVPVGRAVGEEMSHHEPVPAYTVNLFGSLTGIWIFALVSYLQSPAYLWFGLGFVALIPYLHIRQELNKFALTVFAVVIIGVAFSDKNIVWSPYHRLELTPLEEKFEEGEELLNMGFGLTVQQVFYQTALDLSDDFLADNVDKPFIAEIASAYNNPYLLGKAEADVLIVGAGMGNDVAAAIRNNAKSITAVEIDPAIVQFGRDYHPESPYDDSRVTIVVDDARSFFEKNDKKFDVIAFGLLDSHVLLSSFSSVRLDSFVYTVESFEQAKKHLNEGGVVSLSFEVNDVAWIEERLGRMLGQVFGEENIYHIKTDLGNTFIVGDLVDKQVEQYGISGWQSDAAYNDLVIPTDNWPYLYLRNQAVPSVYFQTLIVLAVICFFMVSRSFPKALNPNWHFFFLGAGFLLVEFKSITEFALLFGTTWLVNVFAISGVLMMAVLANLLIMRMKKPLNIRGLYIFLFASLAFNYWLPLDLLNELSFGPRALLSMLLLSSPLFFSGLIFSESLKRAKDTSWPLASNLSGAVLGGILEYSSLALGIKGLYLMAGIVYLSAFAASRFQKIGE